MDIAFSFHYFSKGSMAFGTNRILLDFNVLVQGAKLQLLKDPFLCVPRRFPNATPQTRNTPNMQQGGGSLLPVLPSSMPATLSGINAQCFDMDKMLEYCGAPVRFNRQLRRK